jgi:hypothetical protein
MTLPGNIDLRLDEEENSSLSARRQSNSENFSSIT